MCGIAGQLSFSRPLDPIEPLLERMRHRGPDDDGIYDGGTIRLGFRRLAIVDLSPAGHQPMSNEDGTIWLVFNGEIYNYHELVCDLRAQGHVFLSKTDTEAIVHGYEQWGLDCLQHFNGMFAFALWDARRELLFCARDRFGVKPFYYAQPAGSDELVFASEIKALLCHPRLPRPAANLQMLRDFLAAGHLDHTDQTCFAGIRQLPAAHFLTVTRQGRRVVRYWDLPEAEPAQCQTHTSSQRARWAEQLRDLLCESVRLRLHADVPVGTCLSGGLDSSAIVCLTNKLLFDGGEAVEWHTRGERQKTFSACYEDPRHDERAYIEEVLAATGAEANYTFPGEDTPIEEVIPKVVWHQDEPFGSTSIIAQWHVMQAAARRGMKVLLDGQGADELLAGYHGDFGIALADDLLSRHWTQVVRDAYLARRYHSLPAQVLVRGALNGLLLPDSAVVTLLRPLTSQARNRRTWLGDGLADVPRTSATWQPRRGTHLQTTLYNQATRNSLPALLHFEDRNSMAFSIEARTPFLDFRVAEFVAKLPNAALLRNGITKVVLRDAMRGVLPERVRMRLDKKGFSTPEDMWFRTSLKDWACEILGSRSLAERGFVRPEAVNALFERHLTGTVNESSVLWRIINVELWARMFLDSRQNCV